MCTAISYKGKKQVFGRTLDYERSYGECIAITGRNKRLKFLYEGEVDRHSAIIGMAHVSDGNALYYDGMNEHGVCIAALNFPIYADYKQAKVDKINLASYELIPYILSKSRSVADALDILNETNVTADSYSMRLSPTPLHFIIADSLGAITVEPLECGLKIYDNPYGVLTNSPTFDYHTLRVSEYMSLSPGSAENRIAPGIPIFPYSRGLGAVGLPGDFSSSSRFVRAVYTKENISPSVSEVVDLSHIMTTVNLPCGAVRTESGEPVRTIYTSIMDTEEFTYYYKCYDSLNYSYTRPTEEELDSDGISTHQI